MENKQETITIIKEECTTKDGRKFNSYKMNLDGKKVDLRFTEESDKGANIRMGISKIVVENLHEDKRAFYPRYYCKFISTTQNN